MDHVGALKVLKHFHHRTNHQFWGKVVCKQTKLELTLNKREVCILVGVLRYHLHQLGKVESVGRRIYTEDDVTIKHYLFATY